MRRRYGLLLVAACLIGTGCADTKQARQVRPSGFLSDYRSLLQPGKEGEALLVYRSPEARWKDYDRILLEPVTMWEDPDSKLDVTKRRELQRLIDEFYDLLYVKLSKDYRMVDKPEPGTIRVRAAITHGEPSLTALTVVSKAVPQARVLNAVWTLGSGKPAFAGEISIDAILTDAQRGTLLAAGSDRRVGGTPGSRS